MKIFYFFILIVLCGASDANGLSPTTCSTSQCHAGIRSAPYVHRPLEAGACPICHQQNLEGKEPIKTPEMPSQHPKIYSLSVKNKNDSCIACHDSFRTDLKNSKTVHKPINEKGCVTCHDPHQSNHKYLLKSGQGSQQCFSCHKDLAQKTEQDQVHHQALESQKQCLNCHAAHTSANDHLLREKESKTCLNCHSASLKKSDGSVVENIGSQFKQKAYQHKPFAEGHCSECHNPHGSNHQNLLLKPYSQQFYAVFNPQNSELCFKCHKVDLATKERVSSETSFRNGDFNLHYLHVQGKKTGRTCRACHEVHGSNNPKLLGDWIPYRSYSIPLRFEMTPSGGRCLTACHGVKSYDRLKAVQNEKHR